MCNNNCRQGRDCTCGNTPSELDENFSLIKRLRTMATTGWNPIGDEAADKITELESELLEQARIIGMSGEREAHLLGKIDRLEREIAALKANQEPNLDGFEEVTWITPQEGERMRVTPS